MKIMSQKIYVLAYDVMTGTLITIIITSCMQCVNL
jgi:hypothetical protein